MSSFSSPPDVQSLDIDMSRITPEALAEMRAVFEGRESDTTLCRFLLARNGDVAKATELLSKHNEWKLTNWPIRKESFIREFLKGKVWLNGTDNEGHPLIVYRSCLHLPHDRDVEEMGRMALWWAECVISLMPPDKSKATILIDRVGAGTSNQDMEFVRHAASLFQNNYPERLHRAIVYPSGIVFYSIWALVKLFLDPVTAQKVQPMLYLEGVQQFIDDEHIPVSMGGKCKFVFDPEAPELQDEVIYSKATDFGPGLVFGGGEGEGEGASAASVPP